MSDQCVVLFFLEYYLKKKDCFLFRIIFKKKIFFLKKYLGEISWKKYFGKNILEHFLKKYFFVEMKKYFFNFRISEFQNF